MQGSSSKNHILQNDDGNLPSSMTNFGLNLEWNVNDSSKMSIDHSNDKTTDRYSNFSAFETSIEAIAQNSGASEQLHCFQNNEDSSNVVLTNILNCLNWLKFLLSGNRINIDRLNEELNQYITYLRYSYVHLTALKIKNVELQNRLSMLESTDRFNLAGSSNNNGIAKSDNYDDDDNNNISDVENSNRCDENWKKKNYRRYRYYRGANSNRIGFNDYARRYHRYSPYQYHDHHHHKNTPIKQKTR